MSQLRCFGRELVCGALWNSPRRWREPMKHDDKNTESIGARLYNALQLPPQDIVEADCESVRTRLAAETSLRGARNILSVRPDTPPAPRWRRLVVVPAAAAVLMTLFIGVMWQESETSGIATSADGRVY